MPPEPIAATGGGESSIPHAAAPEFVVNGPERVDLFDITGRNINVEIGDVDYWVEHGFTREKLDLGTVTSEIPQIAAEFARAAVAYIAGVERDGVIDTEDAGALDVAQTALSMLLGRWTRAVQVLSASHPVRQHGGLQVQRTKPDGSLEESAVDPGQLNDYLALGWATVPVEGGLAMRREMRQLSRTNPETQEHETMAVLESEVPQLVAAGWSAGESTTTDVEIDPAFRAALERAGFEEVA